MHKGNWKCSKCGNSITELPFEPDPGRVDQLMCFDCMKEKRGDRKGSYERKMHKGNWKCSECGTPITELPFSPDPEREDTLLCVSCWKAKK